MPLDFHLAKSRQEAPKLRAVFRMEEFDHQSLFGQDIKVGPFLNRLSDYYKDAVFHSQEIPHLAEEIRVVMEGLEEESLVRFTLSDLLEVCLKAEAEGDSLFVFCD